MATKKKSKSLGKNAPRNAGTEANKENGKMTSETLETVVIPLVHEQLQVGKRQVVTGKVKLHKTVNELLEQIELPLQSESVEVLRVPKGEMVSEASGSRQEGDTFILPIYEEVLVVEKQLRLVEEVHIVTKRSERQEIQEVLLRQEKVRLERDGQEVTIEENLVT